MNWRQISGRIVGLYYLIFGVLTLYILYMTIGRTIFEGTGKFLLPTFEASSTNYSFFAGYLSLLIQLVLLVSAGIMLSWKLKRWAAIYGIIGILIPSLILLILEVLVSFSGGPSITKLISIKVLVYSWGLFVGLPVLGIAFAWRDLH